MNNNCICLGICDSSLSSFAMENDTLCKILELDDESDTVLIEFNSNNDAHTIRESIDNITVLMDMDDTNWVEKNNYFNKHGKHKFLDKYRKRETIEFPCSIANILFNDYKSLEDYIKTHRERY